MKLKELLKQILECQKNILQTQNISTQLLEHYLPQINKNVNIEEVAYQIQKETYELAQDGKELKKIREILI